MTLYFITGGGATKIGVTTRTVEQRLKQLQSGSPVPLVVAYSAPGSLGVERGCHHLLRARRLHGEWFDGEVTPAEAREIVEKVTGPQRQQPRTAEHRAAAAERSRAHHARTAGARAFARQTGMSAYVTLAYYRELGLDPAVDWEEHLRLRPGLHASLVRMRTSRPALRVPEQPLSAMPDSVLD